MNSLSILLSGQKVRGYPSKKVLKNLPVDTLANILAGAYTTDVHFVQYAVNVNIGPFRYNNEIFNEHQSVDIIAVAFDVDSPAKKSAEPGALDQWFADERPKIQRLLAAHPGGLAWRTKGGWRVVWYHNRILHSTDDTLLWKKDYLAALVYLEREFDILADPACNDWNRMHRVPMGIREDEPEYGFGEPVRREMFGALCGELDISSLPTEEDRKVARIKHASTWRNPVPQRIRSISRADTNDLPAFTGEGVWFRILSARGLILSESGNKHIIRCPNEAQHTVVSEGSTVLYAPGSGEILGHIHCSHAHCQGADHRTLLAVTDEEWAAAVRESALEAPVVSVAIVTPVCGESPAEAEQRVVAELIPDAVHGHKPSGVAGNVAHLLLHHPDWKGRLVYDSFKHERYWAQLPDALKASHAFNRRVLDGDTVAVQAWLLRGNGQNRPVISSSLENVRMGIQSACAQNTIDSLVELVKAFPPWDGTPRLDTWLTDYMGADDNILSRAIGKRWLIAAIARALDPGCPADMMLILEARQEAGKNHMLDIMFGRDYLVTPTNTAFGSKDFEQACSDAWCVHDDELACSQRAGLETVKAWLTQKTAKFRKAYDRDFIVVPRRFNVCGSTNHNRYLRDEENRRFWPQTIKWLREQELRRDREQIWSEARAFYELGIPFNITKRDELWPLLAMVHESKRRVSPLEEKIFTLIQGNLLPEEFTLFEVLHVLDIPTQRWTDQALLNEIGKSLRRVGFVSARKQFGTDRNYYWSRPVTGPN